MQLLSVSIFSVRFLSARFYSSNRSRTLFNVNTKRLWIVEVPPVTRATHDRVTNRVSSAQMEHEMRFLLQGFETELARELK